MCPVSCLRNPTQIPAALGSCTPRRQLDTYRCTGTTINSNSRWNNGRLPFWLTVLCVFLTAVRCSHHVQVLHASPALALQCYLWFLTCVNSTPAPSPMMMLARFRALVGSLNAIMPTTAMGILFSEPMRE